MSYSLSFSEEFYYSQDPDNTEHPYSVEMAIRAIPEQEWKVLCSEVFGCDPQFVDIDTVMSKIRETDTCSNLDSPVRVWIDSEGYHTVAVHEAPRHVPDLDSKGASLCGAETGEVVAWLDRDFVANCKACATLLQEQD